MLFWGAMDLTPNGPTLNSCKVTYLAVERRCRALPPNFIVVTDPGAQRLRKESALVLGTFHAFHRQRGSIGLLTVCLTAPFAVYYCNQAYPCFVSTRPSNHHELIYSSFVASSADNNAGFCKDELLASNLTRSKSHGVGRGWQAQSFRYVHRRLQRMSNTDLL